LVSEMLDRLEGRYSTMPDDEALQKEFFSLFRPGQFGYGVAGRIGSEFVRRHRDLLRQTINNGSLRGAQPRFTRSNT